MDAVIYGEIPNAKIEKCDKPPPEKAFNTVKKSFPEIKFVMVDVSIKGIGISCGCFGVSFA